LDAFVERPLGLVHAERITHGAGDSFVARPWLAVDVADVEKAREDRSGGEEQAIAVQWGPETSQAMVLYDDDQWCEMRRSPEVKVGLDGLGIEVDKVDT
jgi:hypothetical protein